MQSRLFRVTDRLRSGAELPSARSALLRRGRILRNAILLGFFAVAMTMASALAVLLPLLSGNEALGGVATYPFALAVVALAASAGFAVWDTILSLRALEQIGR